MNNKEYSDAVENKNYPENPLVPLDDPFINDSGTIQNLLNTTINGAAIITSRAGAIRSNHMHQEDFHYLYIVSGVIAYYERDPGQDGSAMAPMLYTAGQMVFTPPKKVHKVIFIEDTIMISLSKRNRDHDSHEEDLIRVEF